MTKAPVKQQPLFLPAPGWHNPDVLSCLANLSNDEVFTPPAVANAMLDMLPQELFRSPETTFLDPACKSGVFLREIAKRLIVGLEKKIPDLQKRVTHILQKQLFGIAITELTSLLSRRTLYCSKYANSAYSISSFDSVTGNIRYKVLKHSWKNGKCIFCGASQEQYERDDSLESHAYEFIHTENPEEIFGDMKFDVIIGNPPYQLSDGGAQASAIPIYDKFIIQAQKLNPTYLTMIIPARWFSGGRGLEKFRYKMFNDKRLQILYDYFDSQKCFPGVDISGGICYFLWNKNYSGDCIVRQVLLDTVSELKRQLIEDGIKYYIRFNQGISIVKKIINIDSIYFDSLVSSQKPFGLRTYVQGSKKDKLNSILIYSNRNILKNPGYISEKDILYNKEWIYKYKVFISSAYGERGSFPYFVLGKPFLGEKNTCCTETFLHIGPFEKKEYAINVISYICTKFFRFLVLLIKNTQHTSKNSYSFVPLQDFSKPWTDAELYAKYQLNQEEIDFIESMIKPMDISLDTESEDEHA